MRLDGNALTGEYKLTVHPLLAFLALCGFAVFLHGLSLVCSELCKYINSDMLHLLVVVCKLELGECLVHALIEFFSHCNQAPILP